MAKLKNKQHELFCHEYLVDLNGTQAAIRAKYSEKTANEQAARLLTKVSIQERVQELLKVVEEKASIKREDIISGFEKIAKDDISNYMDFRTEKAFVGYDDEGEMITEYRNIVDIKDSRTIDTSNIQEISIGKDGQFKFKLYSKDNALTQLGKLKGMYTEKVEHSGTIGLDLSHMSDEELEKERKRLEAARQ